LNSCITHNFVLPISNFFLLTSNFSL
jgi:hypothetical protein